MSDFINGSFSKNCPQRSWLYFTLYADDINICNPIGQARTKHKLTVIYLQILNIPAKYRSKVTSVYPIAIAYSKVFRPRPVDNLRVLLADCVQTLITLSHEGLLLEVLGERQIIYGKCIAFLGDSLAANCFGGFKEGFSQRVRRCCRACNSTWHQMRHPRSFVRPVYSETE